ncbi:MAG: GWxTD domain-containing protein [Melioribacteraceae bacterium]|nr:MAG: GWxTD domain-containing protein [Melioribacteraceae bacterium]
MKKFLAVFMIMILTLPVFAQVENSADENPVYKSFPGFSVDIASYKSSREDKTRVDLFVQVPYQNLQFIKDPEGYRAKYSIHIKFSEKDSEKIAVESTWNETVTAKEFSSTEARSNYNFSVRSFEITPGKYLMRCEVVDRDSRKNFVIEATANVLKLSDSLNVSDILLISSIVKDSDGEKLVPNINRRVTTDDSSLPFYLEVYSDEKRDIKLEYNIKDKDGKKAFVEIVEKEVQPGINRIVHEIDGAKFNLGEHVLEAHLKNFELENVSTVSKKFISKIAGFPDSITDIDLAIDQLMYIATPSEINFITSTNDEETKLKRYRDFWKSKDPSPNTEENEVFLEYYRRIDYANLKFGNYFKGWKSDMGMVYITLGPPSAVERHPFDMGSKPYEIWEYYHINRSFIFVDNTGFGDYRLTSSPYGDWFKYSQ